MKKRQIRHLPVLLPQVLSVLNPQPGQLIVDCTLGLAGHAAALLRRISPTGHLIGIDFDPHNLSLARHNLEKIGSNFTLHHANFAALPQLLGDLRPNALLADVGVASTQIDNPARGFSYKRPGPLDMRMDPTRGHPASHLINTLPEPKLADAFLTLGDETDAPKIAALITHYRAIEPITTTEQLTAIICEARDFTLQRAAGAKLHPAARTFQALRILVNRELANLDHLLRILPTLLAPRATAIIISFHSGEDRLVKHSFRQNLRNKTYAQISPDPLLATAEELEQNPRARSAKLRWARMP